MSEFKEADLETEPEKVVKQEVDLLFSKLPKKFKSRIYLSLEQVAHRFKQNSKEEKRMRKLEDIFLSTDHEISQKIEEWFRTIEAALKASPTIDWTLVNETLEEMKAFIGEGGVVN